MPALSSGVAGGPARGDRHEAGRGCGTALAWRVLRDPPGPAARNMALDHALAVTLDEGTAVVRFYGWDRPTVSFGRNEPAGGYDRRKAREVGIGFVRRPTGGRAVLHADEITYCVAAPQRALGGARTMYAAVNAGLVDGLQRLGVRARLSEGGVALRPDAGPCFTAPVAGEVMLGGRKLIGSAQARIGDRLLQHGSLILSGDQRVLAQLREAGPDARPPAALADALGAVDRAVVVSALVDGLGLALGGAWGDGAYTPEELDAADRLERGRYATDAWTWRR